MVTIRDVAKESGFSSTTVSIVLNNAPLSRYIPAVTKKRIERAAQKLGYRPNQFARSLRSKRSHTVGVMVFDMTDPFCTLILRGIENTLYQLSYLPILTDVHNEGSRFERYLEMLLDRRIEGLIVIANWLFLDINLLADLEKSSIPTAMIGCELKNDSMSSVIVDNEVGGQLALEHLYSLGHRQIAFIRGPKGLTDSSPRWRGIRNFVKQSGLEIDSHLVLDLPESRDPLSSFESGYKLTEDLIRQKRSFTALLAFDDMSAFGAIRALSKSGIRVPEQCRYLGDIHPVADHGAAAHGGDGRLRGGNRGRWHQCGPREEGNGSDAPESSSGAGGAGVDAESGLRPSGVLQTPGEQHHTSLFS
jgi:DNA-binding LacI/PurR family transcriptional regulator